MRRSGAPSQVGRPKFITPFCKLIQSQNVSSDGSKKEEENPTEKSKVLNRILPCNSLQDTNTNSAVDIDESHKTPIIKKDNEDVQHESNEPPIKRPRFQAPTINTNKQASFRSPGHSVTLQNTSSNNNSGNSENTENPTSKCRYFNVVWCKRSNKKHKKWEGDAVLVTQGRSVTLYDTEGKEIGKSSGYKSTELASLREDETLPIGGKEIQVMSLMDEEMFKSGKCFTGAGSTISTSHTVTAPVRNVSKPFSKPNKSDSVGNINIQKPEPCMVTPRYDPNLPGALVMPRPSDSHQWQWNKKCSQVIEVVVDPYIACHLRPHQREGVTFLYECVMGYRNFNGQGAILADDMGLGKTLQCISLIWTLLKQGPYGGKPVAKRILIVTPGSLVKNWYQEFKKWLGTERLNVYAVSSDKKVEDFMKTSLYPVLVISYEMFVRMYDILTQLTFDLIVCDEGHRLKNTNIKTTSLLMSFSTRRRIVLSGTPIQNDLQEFFSIVEFCNPGLLGSSSAFRRVYEDPILTSRQPGASSDDIMLGEERGNELNRMTQMFVLRRTQEINNKYLPPKREIVLFCGMSDLQLRLYQQLLRCQLIRSCLSGSLSRSPHLICIAALKQLCNHPCLIYNKSLQHEDTKHCEDYDDKTSVYEGLYSIFPDGYKSDKDLEEHSGKLSVLSCLLHQLHTSNKHEKIVVVSNHTKTLDLIQCLCEQKGYDVLRLDGQTPTSKRHELVQRFNSKHSKEFIFLLSSKAGGVGLNLVGASRLVLYDIDWNPANDLQAMARVWRDGQKNIVHIYRLLTTGSIEEKVYQRQISKQGLSGAIMDTRDTSDVQFSTEDLRDLFSINLHTRCETHDLLNCDCIKTDRSVSEKPDVDCTSISRSCQLGVNVKHSRKKHNLGMDELMSWKHFTGNIVNSNPSWYLQEATDLISFVFYSEVKENC
ncbi:DNA repair and recombination protein rad54b [Mactra antiquata]